MDFPSIVAVKRLNQEHPDYTKYKRAWKQIGLLYEGGSAIQKAVIDDGMFLTQNTKELPEVYNTRRMRFNYTNLLGNVIGWYISALFKQPVQIAKRLAEIEGDGAPSIPQDAEDFCAAFEKDCNHAGQSIEAFMHDVAEMALLYKSAYVVIDLPVANDDDPVPDTLLKQKQAGLLDPYLMLYDPSKIVNWEVDRYGNLEWIEIYIRVSEQEALEDPATTDYWYIFDRKQVWLYSREVKENMTDAGSPQATLSAGYPRRHATADQNIVPIHRIDLPQGLWLANRVLLPLINHLNLDNAFDFALFQCNLPQLVVEDGPTGTYEEPMTISAVGYHHMPSGGKMYFLEPEGRAFQHSLDRIANIEERIYKACYLMDQARTNRSTPAAQSGISKQQDKTPSRDALSGIGAILQPALQNIYRDVLAVAGFAMIEPNVRGFDFSDKVTAEDIGLLEQATVIPVNSPTFEREIGKKNVRLSLPDMDPETLQVIDGEIDVNPTESEQAAQLAEQQKASRIASFTQSMQGAQKNVLAQVQ